MTITADIMMAIFGTISAAVGGGITYVTAVQKNKSDKKMAIQQANHQKEMAIQQHKQQLDLESHRWILDLQTKYDISLREMRIEPYKELWKRLRPLARYPEFSSSTYGKLAQFSKDLSEWYYSTTKVISVWKQPRSIFSFARKDENEPVGADIIKNIASNEAHELRIALANDVGTRQERLSSKS